MVGSYNKIVFTRILHISGIFYIGQFMIIAVGIYTTIFITNLEKQGHYNWPAPRWMVNLFVERLPVFLGMRLSFKKLIEWQENKFVTVPKDYGENVSKNVSQCLLGFLQYTVFNSEG